MDVINEKSRAVARNRCMEESMKRISLFAILTLSIVSAGVAFSQEQAIPETAAPQIGAPPQMKEISFLVGFWDVAMQVKMAPEAPWMETKAVSTCSLVLDGCAMQSTFEGDMAGMPMKGIMFTCFNRTTGKWQASWIDNFGAAISLYEGELKDGKLIFAGEDKMPQGTMLTRITQFNMTNTKFDWLMENSMDGGKTWFESMKAVYTKRQ